MKRHGFTLLELVISCALIISIMSFVTMTMTRVHRLRAETSAQTELLSDGRALLDRLADDLHNVCGTNLSLSTDGENELKLVFVRTLRMPRTATTGESFTNTPFAIVEYLFTGALARTECQWGDSLASVKYTNTGTRLAFSKIVNGETTATNVFAGSGDTALPPANRGDTVSIPITSGSSHRVSDIITDYDGWIDISSDETDITGLTNHITAAITFTNRFNITYANYVKRPVVGQWTEPAINLTTFFEVLRADATTYGTNTLISAAMAYTNAPYADLNTNSMDGVTALSVTNMFFPAGLTITNAVTYFAAQPSVFAGSNRWNFSDRYVVIDDRGQVSNPTLTNYLGSTAMNPTNLPNAVYNEGYYQHNAYISSNAFAIGDIPEDLLTDIPDYTVNNLFTPHQSNGKPIPLSISRTAGIWSINNANGFLGMTFGESAYEDGAALGNIITNFTSTIGVSGSTRTIVTTNLAFAVISLDYEQITTYSLETFALKTLVPENYYEVRHTVTNKNYASTDEDTEWVDRALTEDFEGAIEKITGLWLEEVKRQDSEIEATEYPTYDVTAAEARSLPMNSARSRVYDFVHKVVMTPLAFVESDDIEKRFELVPWEPDHSEELSPPVCVDVYLELLTPTHKANAYLAADGDAYIRAHVVRLSRRIPLATHNMWNGWGFHD